MGPDAPPLVVDLDGTLIFTDTLAESVLRLLRQDPLAALRMPLWLLRGRAALKDEIARRVSLRVERLPYREPLLEYLRSVRGSGRRIVLATAAHRSIAEAIATHLGVFDEVIATDATRNLKGRHKLEAIRQRFGDEFVYAGDSAADVPIWNAARAAVLVGVSPGVERALRGDLAREQRFEAPAAGARQWLRALRVHQWLKNLLLFVPLLTAFSFGPAAWLAALAAFAAFSMAASATYVMNDLWDLDSDRGHPRKRLRPFASGAIGVVPGVVVAGLLMAAALVLAPAISRPFFMLLLVYVATTTLYSWVLKEYVLVDVLVLSALYCLRIMAGAAAIDIPSSTWLIAFSAFLFLSLALAKRGAELMLMQSRNEDSTPGRDYTVGDLVVLWPMGVGAAMSSVVVFGLFITAPETQQRYASPQALWLVAVGLTYWLGRLWLKTARGEMHDDPLVYALRDRGSRLVILGMVVVTLAAHSLSP